MTFTPVFTAPPRKIRKIALEEHFVTPPLAGYAKANSLTVAQGPMEYFKSRLMDLDSLRIEEMDRCGIDLSVLSVTAPGVQVEPDAAVALREAREVNDLLAKAIQRHPTRLAGFAHIALQNPVEGARELERAVTQLGFKGALINGHTNGEYLDNEKFFPFLERAESLGVPIYLHPANAPDVPHVLDGYPELLGAMWNWQCDTATQVLRLIMGGVFDRFPNLTLILGHMGEGLPFVLWRLDSRYVIVPHNKNLRKQPSQYIRDNIVITTSGVDSFPPLLCSILALGADRIMFSIDYPYESSQEAARFIDFAPISEMDRDKICHLNAERILKIV